MYILFNQKLNSSKYNIYLILYYLVSNHNIENMVLQGRTCSSSNKRKQLHYYRSLYSWNIGYRKFLEQ